MKIRTLLFILFFTLLSNAQVKLSSNAEISIITVAPGKELIDTWGHSAIRIKDKRFDVVFNYGTFDFNTPNFYTKFMQGKLLYDLSVGKFHYFIRSYINENRTVTEQLLNLSIAQKQAYFNFLQNNAKPENKKYLYDFFFDNCATKLRSVNTEILKDNVLYNDELFTQDNTFRDLIYQKLEDHPWGKFGIDLALGSVIDRQAAPKEFSFLPSYVLENFKVAQIIRDGNKMPLVKKTIVLYRSKEEVKSYTIFTPLVIFSLLSLVVLLITYNDYKKNKQTKIIDFLLLFITGLLGLLIVLLWFATDHTATKDNYNMFWALLPNLGMSFYIFKKRKQVFLKRYYLVLLISLIITIGLWLFKIQVFNLALIPILIMLGVRYIWNYYYLWH